MTEQGYQPSSTIITRYAQVLVNFALNSGQGIKPGDVVECIVPDVAKPMAIALHDEVLKAGGQPMLRLLPTGLERNFYQLASEEQLKFFPKKYLKAKADLIDHHIVMIADVDPFELSDIDPIKIITARDARRTYRNWLVEKETHGKFTWTAGLWGVEAKAKLAGLSLEEYWQQIIKACFLDFEEPVTEWKALFKQQEQLKKTLNALEIEYLEVKGPDVDLRVKLGADRVWQGGSGRNIPSFEFFTSPDWRGTNGWIKFNQPVYRYGQVLDGVELEFKDGLVTRGTATRGQSLLDQMLTSKNADKVGEFSLTDRRMSRITHVMAETLYDENISGPFGNMHLALGSAYRDCYRGDAALVKKSDWAKKGFNESAEHTDIVTTTDRTVVAYLSNGESMTLYKDGQFTLIDIPAHDKS
jgi:aminopeptidase